jgi:MFS family permease
MVDRAKLVRITHVWLAASAASLAILGWLHLLNGNLILLFVFLIGAGFAFNAPAFSSLLTDIVSDEELPSASVLSGLQLDIAGMIGPALGGALIPLIGTNTIFAANGACFLPAGAGHLVDGFCSPNAALAGCCCFCRRRLDVRILPDPTTSMSR